MIITIIGNKTNPNQEQIADGGRIKVSLYYRVLKEEGFDVRFIELEGWMKRFALLVIKIKKAVMRSDVVLIMGGPRGSRVLITLCNLFNRKGKTRIIYSMLGVGTIQQKIKSLSPKEIAEFLNGTNNYGIKDSSMGRKLRKLSLVLAENDVQAKFYNNFYGLSNVSIMENFRIINNRHIYQIDKNTRK